MTDTPYRPADVAAPRRLRRWLAPLVLGLTVALLAGGGAAAWLLTRPEPAPVAAAVTTAPSLALLSEHETCVRLKPLLVQAARMNTDYTTAGVTPGREESTALRAALREVQKVAPADMSPHIGQVMKAVSLLPAGGAGIDMGDWGYASDTLARRCRGMD